MHSKESDVCQPPPAAAAFFPRGFPQIVYMSRNDLFRDFYGLHITSIGKNVLHFKTLAQVGLNSSLQRLHLNPHKNSYVQSKNPKPHQLSIGFDLLVRNNVEQKLHKVFVIKVQLFNFIHVHSVQFLYVVLCVAGFN